jgi:hypothetical protein
MSEKERMTEIVDEIVFGIVLIVIVTGIVFGLTHPCNADVITIPNGNPPPTTSSSQVVTIQPPVGLPTHVYPGANGGPATVVPPVGLPTFIYGR